MKRVIQLKKRRLAEGPLAPSCVPTDDPHVIPLRIPVIAPVDKYPSDRLQTLPSAVLHNLVLPYFGMRDSTVFHTVSRGMFHLFQSWLSSRGAWKHAYHLYRLALYYQKEGWDVAMPKTLSIVNRFHCHVTWQTEMPVDVPSFVLAQTMLRGIQTRMKDVEDRIQKNKKIVFVFWSAESLRNMVCTMTSDCALSDNHIRVLEAGMKKMDAALDQLPASCYRVLHATPLHFGGPLRSGIAVVQSTATFLEER
jgi:hypothetical protein